MGSVTPISSAQPFAHDCRTTLLVNELNRILGLLRAACPRDAAISFDFDGELHVHIDVRGRENVAAVEALLPTLGAGLFHSLTRRPTPNRPFLHRVSALVGER